MVDFADDHPIDILQGMRRPKPSQIRKMMLRRCQFLVQRLTEDLIKGVRVPNDSFFLDELAAIVVVMESYEREQALRT